MGNKTKPINLLLDIGKLLIGGFLGFLIGQIAYTLVLSAQGNITDPSMIFGYNIIFVIVPTVGGAALAYYKI